MEDKTLTTREIRVEDMNGLISSLDGPMSPVDRGKPWTRGDGDATEESRQSCEDRGRDQQTGGG